MMKSILEKNEKLIVVHFEYIDFGKGKQYNAFNLGTQKIKRMIAVTTNRPNANLISYMQYSWHVHDSRRALPFPLGKEKRIGAQR